MRLPWRSVLLAELFAVGITLIRWLGGWSLPDVGFKFSVYLLVRMLAALILLVAALRAGEAVRAGARAAAALWRYIPPAAVGVLLLMLAFSPHLVLISAGHVVDFPPDQRLRAVWILWIDTVLFGGIAMWAYVNRLAALKVVEALRRAELRRVSLDRDVAETDLAAAQALVDPAALFRDMGSVRAAYAAAAPDAEMQLDRLIDALRDTRRRRGPSTLPGAAP